MQYIKMKFEKKESVIQYQVHEFQGCLKTTEDHFHRFTGITGEAIPINKNDHIHEVVFRTDFINGHYHEYVGRTSGAITIGDRHIHHLESFTGTNFGHKHGFRLITLLQDPCGD